MLDHAYSLFGSRFTNYSVNSSHFEMACFSRWIALNNATLSLPEDELVCLLDTDVFIGVHPSIIKEQAQMLSGGVNLDFLAEWWCNDTDSISGVGPEITIISKRLLQGFCEFLICEYFDYTNKQELIRCFYQNISTGVHSGISDMHALATFLNLAQGNYFNLRNLTDFRLIGNLTHYQDNANSNDLDWSISFRSGSQILRENNRIFKLAGTHFRAPRKIRSALASRRQ